MLAFYPKTTSQIMHKGKAGNIYRLDGFDKCVRLHEKLLNDKNYEIHEVTVTNENKIEAEELVLSAHPNNILEAYKIGQPEDLANSSGVLWQPSLYDFVLECSLACKAVVDTSIDSGNVSLAITGGGHHAEKDRPLGFCTINTMAISALYAAQKYQAKVAIIDLDVHYSNGCFDILKDNESIFCTSLWNLKVDKWKYFDPENNIWHQRSTDKTEYFNALEKLLKVVEDYHPSFIIYHLGMDVLDTDRMGGIKDFKNDDLLIRENIIKNFMKILTVPYAIFLGGAYIDYSKGEEFANKQKAAVTSLQKQAINIHNSYLVKENI